MKIGTGEIPFCFIFNSELPEIHIVHGKKNIVFLRWNKWKMKNMENGTHNFVLTVKLF